MSATTVYLPGFSDPIHDAQRTFRALLNAQARPGTLNLVTAEISSPEGLNPACAAACLTLWDLEVQVWLQPSFSPQVRAWLSFHTGCQFVTETEEADFALIADLTEMPELSDFYWGTAEQPETSTTLLIQIASWQSGQPVTLTGSGILDRQAIAPQLPYRFWDDWEQNRQAYPLGVDVFCFTQDTVMGLPRTVNAEVRNGLRCC